MIMVIATFVIAGSFIGFFFLFSNIFTPLFMDVPATIKLKRKGLLKTNAVLKNYTNIVLVHSAIAFGILAIAYYLFIKYSFGFSVSLFIGACFALALSLWKMIWLFFRYSDNYTIWLDFYRKENKQYLDTIDMDVITEALKK